MSEPFRITGVVDPLPSVNPGSQELHFRLAIARGGHHSDLNRRTANRADLRFVPYRGLTLKVYEFERTLIKARTGEGRERAKGRGVRFGRPLKLSAHQRREAIERLDAGDAVVDVARTFGVDRATLYRMRAEAAQ
jgi:hypothetical protein